jgi:hypothetical protein
LVAIAIGAAAIAEMIIAIVLSSRYRLRAMVANLLSDYNSGCSLHSIPNRRKRKRELRLHGALLIVIDPR